MSKVKLIIEIDDKAYSYLKNTYEKTDVYSVANHAFNAIIDGTPLTESDDCVSRAEVLSHAETILDIGGNEYEVVETANIKRLSSVQPKAIKYDDCVSRQAVIDIFDSWWNHSIDGETMGYRIEDLPSVQPKITEYNDCVSREEALHSICKNCEWYQGFKPTCINKCGSYKRIMKLPSVQLKQDKGEWKHGICDKCGYDWSKDAPIASVPNFCPNCGNDMRGKKNEEV